MFLKSVVLTPSGGKTRRKSRVNYQARVHRQVAQVRLMVHHKILRLGLNMLSLTEALVNLVRIKLKRLETAGACIPGPQITVGHRLNLANVRAKVILHKKKLSHTFFCCDKIRLQIHSIFILQ